MCEKDENVSAWWGVLEGLQGLARDEEWRHGVG